MKKFDVLSELLEGCYSISTSVYNDLRGQFTKDFCSIDFSSELGIKFDIRETFFSSSKKNVLRGMHFQEGSFKNSKLISCVGGAILDVVLDLRKGESYGNFNSRILSAENAELLYVPEGVAHGFLALTNSALVLYKSSNNYSSSHDMGILWNSFGFNWEIDNPIISERDISHIRFEDYESTF